MILFAENLEGFNKMRKISYIFLLILFSIFQNCSSFDKVFNKSDLSGKSPHEICNEYKDWEKQMTAYDSKEKFYYIFTSKDKIVFLSPYNTLIYSREGHVIGFQRDGIFHFHKPSKGWKKINIKSVGPIKNKYEGYDDYADFSSYTAPPSLVTGN